jgi:hypothetical protein
MCRGECGTTYACLPFEPCQRTTVFNLVHGHDAPGVWEVAIIGGICKLVTNATVVGSKQEQRVHRSKDAWLPSDWIGLATKLLVALSSVPEGSYDLGACHALHDAEDVSGRAQLLQDPGGHGKHHRNRALR